MFLSLNQFGIWLIVIESGLEKHKSKIEWQKHYKKNNRLDFQIDLGLQMIHMSLKFNLTGPEPVTSPIDLSAWMRGRGHPPFVIARNASSAMQQKCQFCANMGT
jgi:hypothetical protein